MYPGYWADLQPDKPAAINTFTGETVTYGQLDSRSNQLARLLYAEGLRRGGPCLPLYGKQSPLL